jgi:hypothetical protein
MVKQASLIQFEQERFKEKLIPPLASNSFYEVGDGEIILNCIRNQEDDYRFDLRLHKGKIYTGFGNFFVVGDIKDIERPYRSMRVDEEVELFINQGLTISGELQVYGKAHLMQHARIYSRGNGKIIFNPSSTLYIDQDSDIIVEKSATFIIYGTIDVHIAKLNALLSAPNLIIDSAAIINVSGIKYNDTEFSLIQYVDEINKTDITQNTRRETNFDRGRSRIAYVWADGHPSHHSHTVDIQLMLGDCPLGYFKFGATGLLDHLDDNQKSIRNLEIHKRGTLYIQEEYRDTKFMHPELYVGVIIGNNKVPGKCICEGTIICDGPRSRITVDRGGRLIISETGSVYIRNQATLRSTNNDNICLEINGKLIIDDIDQIKSLKPENVKFGKNGKLIILNPEREERRILFSTPDGLLESDLYRIFRSTIDHIEFHVSKNTGIKIDHYYEFFNRDLTKWFGDRRIEKAIFDKILVWHDGGYIELDREIIPWVNEYCDLTNIAGMFKTYGDDEKVKLQDLCNRLRYAKSGNIIFRFVYGEYSHEVPLTLNDITIVNAYYNHPISKYNLTTTDDGFLFLQNNVKNISKENLIKPSAKRFNIINKKVEFAL